MVLFQSKRIKVIIENGMIVSVDGRIRTERNDTEENRKDAIAEAEALTVE